MLHKHQQKEPKYCVGKKYAIKKNVTRMPNPTPPPLESADQVGRVVRVEIFLWVENINPPC